MTGDYGAPSRGSYLTDTHPQEGPGQEVRFVSATLYL